MPIKFKYGMDQEYWDWSPIVKRPVLQWPNGARLAVCLLVDLGHYEWQPPAGAFDPPTHTPPHSQNPYPDYVTVTHREYGHRDGAETGLLLAFRLHPWCMGQPYRIKYLEEIIAHMARRQGVWIATGAEIADWYRKQPHASFKLQPCAER